MIITNRLKWYDTWLASREWNQDVYFWRLDEGVYLIPEEHRRKRVVEAHTVKANKVLKIVGPGLAGVTEDRFPKVACKSRSRAALIDSLVSGEPLPENAMNYLIRHRSRLIEVLPDEESGSSQNTIS